MARAYLLIGLFALSLFAWGQYRGVGLFDHASSQSSRLTPGQRSTFHK